MRNALIYASRFGEGGDDSAQNRRQNCATSATGRGCGSRVRTAWGRSRCRKDCYSIQLRGSAACPGDRSASYSSPAAPSSSGSNRAQPEGLGYSYAVSSGNELDLDMADYINFLVDDDHTRVIACMAEG